MLRLCRVLLCVVVVLSFLSPVWCFVLGFCFGLVSLLVFQFILFCRSCCQMSKLLYFEMLHGGGYGSVCEGGPGCSLNIL